MKTCPICKKSWDRCKCDLGIKVGSKEEAAWKTIFDNATRAIEEAKRSIELNEICAAHAEKRMIEEKEKFK